MINSYKLLMKKKKPNFVQGNQNLNQPTLPNKPIQNMKPIKGNEGLNAMNPQATFPKNSNIPSKNFQGQNFNAGAFQQPIKNYPPNFPMQNRIDPNPPFYQEDPPIYNPPEDIDPNQVLIDQVKKNAGNQGKPIQNPNPSIPQSFNPPGRMNSNQGPQDNYKAGNWKGMPPPTFGQVAQNPEFRQNDFNNGNSNDSFNGSNQFKLNNPIQVKAKANIKIGDLPFDNNPNKIPAQPAPGNGLWKNKMNNEDIDPNQDLIDQVKKNAGNQGKPIQNPNPSIPQSLNPPGRMNFTQNPQDNFKAGNWNEIPFPSFGEVPQNPEFRQNDFNNGNSKDSFNGSNPFKFNNPIQEQAKANIMAGGFPLDNNPNNIPAQLAQGNDLRQNNMNIDLQPHPYSNKIDPSLISNPKSKFPKFPDVHDNDALHPNQPSQMGIPFNVPNNFSNQNDFFSGTAKMQPLGNRIPPDFNNIGQNNFPNQFSDNQKPGENSFPMNFANINLSPNSNQDFARNTLPTGESRTLNQQGNNFLIIGNNSPDPPTHKDPVTSAFDNHEKMGKMPPSNFNQSNVGNTSSIQNDRQNQDMASQNIFTPLQPKPNLQNINVLNQDIIQGDKAREDDLKTIIENFSEIPEMKEFEMNKLKFNLNSLKNNFEEYKKRKQSKEEPNPTIKMNSYYNKIPQNAGNNHNGFPPNI